MDCHAELGPCQSHVDHHGDFEGLVVIQNDTDEEIHAHVGNSSPLAQSTSFLTGGNAYHPIKPGQHDEWERAWPHTVNVLAGEELNAYKHSYSSYSATPTQHMSKVWPNTKITVVKTDGKIMLKSTFLLKESNPFLHALVTLHTKLQDLLSEFWWHWMRSSSAKTAAAGIAAVPVVMTCGAASVLALAGTGAAVGVGAAVSDVWAGTFAATGIKEATDEAVGLLIEMQKESTKHISQETRKIGHVEDSGFTAAQLGTTVHGGMAAVHHFGEVGTILTAAGGEEAAMAAAESAAGAPLASWAGFLRGGGALIAVGVAVHSWAYKPPSYNDLEEKVNQVGNIIDSVRKGIQEQESLQSKKHGA